MEDAEYATDQGNAVNAAAAQPIARIQADKWYAHTVKVIQDAEPAEAREVVKLVMVEEQDRMKNEE